MEIHQFIVGAAPSDAITREALQIQGYLSQIGPSYVFAQHIAPEMTGVHHVDEYPLLSSARARTNLLFVHGSIGDPAFFDFLLQRRERMVLRYHNMTPPELVRAYDERVAVLLEEGRRELSTLAPRVAVALATSHFSAVDLEGLGYSRIGVVPVMVDVPALKALNRPDADLPGIPPRGDGPLVLFVGRLSPHKNQAELVKAFHVLKTYLRPDAHLALVGSGLSSAYAQAVRRFTNELALIDVSITGAVSDPQLAAIYRRADVFVTLSAHEGFCVPLVEAMNFGVPIVARNVAAIGETLGGAGVLLDEPSPVLVAETVAQILSEPSLREAIVARGRQRAEELQPQRSAAELLEHLLRVA